MFSHANKFYMHKPEFVLENETHIILYHLEIQTDHPMLTRRQDFVFINQKKKLIIQ